MEYIFVRDENCSGANSEKFRRELFLPCRDPPCDLTLEQDAFPPDIIKYGISHYSL